MLEINDEESLKKENITIDDSKREFNEILQKAISLREKIEKQIQEINQLYEKVNKEVKNSFELKHEQLIKEENSIKEKLDNEVTKIKEGLENFLSESNKVIKENERINKGLKSLEKDNENNIIKILSYISKMNKNKKETEVLFQYLMKNLKIDFKEEESNIAYSEYYFNGIPTPKDIEIKDIFYNSVSLFWKIDDLNIINVDNKNIKFRVEIRKGKDKFVQVYEGNKQNCTIDNLVKDTKYEFRICSFYNDLIGSWTKAKEFKTLNFDCESNILLESKRETEFLEKIIEWTGYKKLDLIYRASRDGFLSKNFHEKCDHKGPTVVLYKNDKGYIFGGYASIPWTSEGNYHKAPDCFIFTLTNIHNSPPTKFPTKDNDQGTYHNSSYGPTFGEGCDIKISSDFINNDSSTDFPCRYKDSLGKGKSVFTGNFDNSSSNYRIKEIEIFLLFK